MKNVLLVPCVQQVTMNMHQLERTFTKAFLNKKYVEHKNVKRLFWLCCGTYLGACGHEIYYVQSGKIVENVWIIHQH
jgi:hypothetical protein